MRHLITTNKKGSDLHSMSTSPNLTYKLQRLHHETKFVIKEDKRILNENGVDNCNQSGNLMSNCHHFSQILQNIYLFHYFETQNRCKLEYQI